MKKKADKKEEEKSFKPEGKREFTTQLPGIDPKDVIPSYPNMIRENSYKIRKP